jgi:Methyltransferase domain
LSTDAELSSFRDPTSRVSISEGRLVRSFDEDGARAFLAVHDSGVLQGLIDDGLLIKYEIEGRAPLRVASPIIPFVSYPNEWTFEMLKTAALLTLRVGRRVWSAGFHLRDASAYNVVFNGQTPTFVDLGSFGQGVTPLWNGYGQFCDHFLNPLLVQAKTGVPFRDLWTVEGIGVHQARRVLRGWDSIGSGTLRNVVLRARLESGLADADREVRDSARSDIGLPAARVDHIMQGMERLVSKLSSGSVPTNWSEYGTSNSYDRHGHDMRDHAVSTVAKDIDEPTLALDIGTNNGRHASILADTFSRVVAMDSDESAIEVARGRFEDAGLTDRVSAIVCDIAAPTPGAGFMNMERSSLLERLRGLKLSIWMAVIHHLVLGRSIPIGFLAELARQLSPNHLVEFVDLDDPMAQLLVASKSGVHHAYDRATFEREFGDYFRVEQIGEPLPTRCLYRLAAH